MDGHDIYGAEQSGGESHWGVVNPKPPKESGQFWIIPVKLDKILHNSNTLYSREQSPQRSFMRPLQRSACLREILTDDPERLCRKTQEFEGVCACRQ